MNLNRIKKNILNRDWNSKNTKTNVNYIKGKLNQFGLSIPKYLKQGSLTPNQIQTQTKRIVKEIEKQQVIVRQQANKPSMKKTMELLEKTVNKHNQLVSKQLLWLQKQNKISDKRIDYLLGKEIQTSDYHDADKKNYMQYTDTPFKVFNVDNLYFDSIDSVNNMIKRIKAKDKLLTHTNINKILKNNYAVVSSLRNVLKGYVDDGNILQDQSKAILHELKQLDGVQQDAFYTIWANSSPKSKYEVPDDEIEELNSNIMNKWGKIFIKAREI